MEWTATARWIFPVDGRPIENGTITLCGESIGPIDPAGVRTPGVDFGNAGILPGLVNAHTHLDLSFSSEKTPPTHNFTDWLRSLVRHRREVKLEQVQSAIESGLADCLRFGVTLVADIAGEGRSWATLSQAALRATVFYELLGLTEERACGAWQNAQAWLGSHPATSNCRPGLSPHAPYSVRESLFRNVAAYVRQRAPSLPVSVHLAESQSERDLLCDHGGPFVDFLTELGVWDSEGLASSHQQVLEILRDLPHMLWIHANFLDPEATLGPQNTLVYCPRTHAAFGHPPHPFRDFLGRGRRIALGTDSLASNPDLDVLAEARFLHQRYPDVSGADLLRMMTLNGAEALGWAETTGSLSPGKSADFVVLPLPDRKAEDPHELIFTSDTAVQETFFRGRQRLEKDLPP